MTDRTKDVLLPVNLLVFGACMTFLFTRNLNGLFDTPDGLYMLVNSRDRLTSIQPTFSFTNDFLQSIGNIQFLQNPKLLFYLWPLAWFSDPDLGRIGTYLIIGVMVFLSAYGMARFLSQGRATALTAGWILGLLAMPVVPAPFFYPILSLSPSGVLQIVSPVIGYWLLRHAGRSTLKADVLVAVGLLLLVWYILVTVPALIVLLLPGAVPYLALALLLADSRSEVLRKLAVLAGVAIVALCLNWHWYLLGLFSDTAAHVFPDDFTSVYRESIYVSIVFHGSLFGWAGPALFGASAVGALLSLRDARLRTAAWLLLAAMAVLLSCVAVASVVRNWTVPPMIYIEMVAWPLYAVFAAVALRRVAGIAVFALPPLSSPTTNSVTGLVLLPLLAAGAAIVIALNKPPWFSGVSMPRDAPLVELLRSEVAFKPGAQFRGRVATVVPVAESRVDPWSQQFAESLKLWQGVGNDHMLLGLWNYWIPTLFEYNQFSSPFFHTLIRRTLQRPVLPHLRNVTIISFADPRVLKLLGVRFVLAPQEESPVGVRRATQEVAGSRWGLFELNDPNLATYSPISVETRHDLASSLDFVADDRVDLSQAAVTTGQVGGPLVRADSSSVTSMDGDLHVVARSSGRSLLVVPLEYSHCIEVRDRRTASNEEPPWLVRTNGVLAGILFERELDVVLAFRIGPLRNPTCRWRDYQELRTMLRR